MAFSPTFWDDLLIPDTAFRNGASPPAFTTFLGTTQALEFDAGEQVFLSVQVPHSWKEGTTLKPHAHIACPNTTAGNIVIGLEYTIAKPDEIFPSPAAPIESAVFAVPGVAYQHFIVPLPDITMTGKTLSSIIVGRLYRKSGVASAYPNGIFILGFDFHYQVDSLGSLGEYLKT